MELISPKIRLLTYHNPQDNGIQLTTFIIEHGQNNFHLQGSTQDTVYVFQESIALYVLSTNSEHGTMSLNTYMAPEPDAINTVFLHSEQEIEDVLGDMWEQMSPMAMTRKLINYLI